MKIFLTGGTGFVGSHVVEKLLDDGHEVVALVRATSDTEHLSTLDVEMVEGSLGEATALRPALDGVDAVIHVAGITGAPSKEVLYSVNTVGTRDLVDVVAEVAPAGTRFVYISSVSAQGPSTGETPRPAHRAPEPVSHYGRSKLDGEGAVLAHRDHLDVTIVRPPVVYGPRDRDMFEVFQLASRRLSPLIGGEQRWLSVIHGEDAARAVVACLKAPGEGEIYTIDDGNCYTWRDLGDLIAEAVGKRTVTVALPKWIFAGAATVAEFGGGLLNTTATFNRDKYREMVQSSWVCGYEKIRHDLDWAPKWELGAGARQTVQWYRQEGWL